VPRRKERILVTLDTNVVVSYYLSRHRQSASAQIVRLWRDQRQLQLVVSDVVINEYLEVLRRVGVSEERIARLMERFKRRQTVTHVNLGTRYTESRDPDDNLILATAAAGKVKFLVTNDHDLLDIPDVQRRRFKFEIVTPQKFLIQVANAAGK